MNIGTSGFSFKDWIGTVYPSDTKRTDMFNRYVELGLNAVELNFTYYSMPHFKTIESLVGRSPKNFMFSVKLNKKFTHEIWKGDVDGLDELSHRFHEGLYPLTNEHKLGAIIAQFPYSFKNEPRFVDYVKKLHDFFGDVLVVEFRNYTWNKKELLEEFAKEGVSVAGVDVPPLKELFRNDKPLGPISYFRFHGRNANWFNFRRYDYLYSHAEIDHLASLTSEVKEPIFVFFNNSYNGQAVQNALELMKKVSQKI